MLKQELAKLFLDRINPPFDATDEDCWAWDGYTLNTGYGGIHRKSGKLLLAHRLSYRLWKGIIPKDLYVLHKCDIKNCINPNHLYLGTYRDNALDRVARCKSFNPRLENNACAKLTNNQVLEIRILLKSKKYKHQEIANIFKVSRPTISAINSGRNWGLL